jgi:hypothetical protein
MAWWNIARMLLLAGAVVIASGQVARAQSTASAPPIDQTEQNPPGASAAYPGGDYYQQLGAAGVECCGGSNWGCGGSPYRTGPGCGDDWMVGPRWRVAVDGVIMFREETNLDALAGAMGVTLADAEQYENFDHGAGIRLLVAAYWPQCKNYELVAQITAVEEWNANIVLPVESSPPIVGPPVIVGVDERRTLTYNSSLNTVEVNCQALNTSVWKPYAGIRYFGLDEVIEDRTNQYASHPLAVTQTAVTTSELYSTQVDNNLIGFQLGLRRDMWKMSRKVYVEGFVNAGVYCNLINRADTFQAVTTTRTVLEDNPGTTTVDETGQIQTLRNATGNRVKVERARMAFAGEASLSLVWKVNSCCALRSGYQVMMINGVELADDAFLGVTESEDLVYHGGFAGFEYRR